MPQFRSTSTSVENVIIKEAHTIGNNDNSNQISSNQTAIQICSNLQSVSLTEKRAREDENVWDDAEIVKHTEAHDEGGEEDLEAQALFAENIEGQGVAWNTGNYLEEGQW